MKSVYTILPIYDSLAKRDWQRSGAVIPVYSSRHRLPSWQYNTQADTPGAVTRIDLVDNAGNLTNITTYFPTLSKSVVLAVTGTYYEYTGDTLNALLPFGAYYLKITHANGYIYYSEWIIITDIYPKLVTSWTNVYYETFVSSGSIITSAIETGISGQANSNNFNLNPKESITVIFYLTKNSGENTNIGLYSNDKSSIISTQACTVGLNSLTFTATIGGSYFLFFYDNAATNFSTSEVYVIESFSANFIRIDFSNTYDLGDICYQNSFTQSLWLNTYLNTPTHEPVLTGVEKNGIFIAEKIVTKFEFRIIARIGREFYRGLVRLPQHDTIIITDEVGNTYNPKPGNITVNPVSWEWFDTGNCEIIFNDNNSIVWTSTINNLT